jgi:UrcA family protein
MFEMLRLMIAAACVMAPAAASARGSVVLIESGYSALVNYSDLNLGSRAGQAALKHRIQKAAGMICFDPADSYTFGYSPTNGECYRVAMASGTGQMEALLPAPR